MKYLTALLLLLAVSPCHAQFSEPGDPGGRFLKRDATGFYFTSLRDSGCIVHYAADSTYYTKTSAAGIPLEEGGLIGSGAQWRGKQGRWTSNYASGYPQLITHFSGGHETGEHTDYYPRGQVQQRYTLSWIDGGSPRHAEAVASLMSGLYQHFYESGQLMEEGYYKLAVDSCSKGAAKTLGGAAQAQQLSPDLCFRSVPCGIWWYYHADGSLKRFKVQH